MPAKQVRGRSSVRANHTGGCEPSAAFSFSEKLVNGTRQRCSGDSQRRQCGEAVLRTLVTPGSTFLPFSAKAGDGMPQRIIDRLRALSRILITGAAVLGKI